MDVLIVGAGPVGLLLGAELRQVGLAVRIIDAGREEGPHSRANVVWPRTLELLDRTGVARRLLERGHRLAGSSFYSAGRHIGTVRLAGLRDTFHPHGVMIPQYETERVLSERLAELGTGVEWGVRLDAVRSAGTERPGDRPRAVLRHADGREEDVEPGWLVGADGAHSTLRHLLGIGYEGESVDVTFAIGDAELRTPLSEELSHYCYSPRGAVVLGPMGAGVFRMAVNVPHDAQAPDADVFQRVLDERGAGGSVVDDLRWSATFRVRCRLASSFRSGRCFLVGDAAHVISPAGGQGMNTGMQDAVNLAWKLGGVVRGGLGPRVLDGYEGERRAAARRVSRDTAFMTRFGVATTPVGTAVRDTAFRVAHRTRVLQRIMAPRLGQTDTGYDEDLPLTRFLRGGTAPAGARLPVVLADKHGAASSVSAPWPVVDRDRYTLLLWPGMEGRTPRPAWAERARALALGRVAVLVPERGTHPAVGRALGRRPAVAVVRPDGHLHALVDPSPDSVAAVLDSLPLTGGAE